MVLYLLEDWFNACAWNDSWFNKMWGENGDFLFMPFNQNITPEIDSTLITMTFEHCANSESAATDSKPRSPHGDNTSEFNFQQRSQSRETKQNKGQNYFSDNLPRDWHAIEPSISQYSNSLIRKHTKWKLPTLIIQFHCKSQFLS